MIVRQPYWEDALGTYIDRMSEERFEFGTNDCASFSAGAVRAMTGTDPAEAFRGQYHDAIGAKQALRDHGQGTLLKTVHFWFPDKKHVALAHRGDLVMKDRQTVGVCLGLFSAFMGEEQGQDRLVYWPTKDCAYAFSVPYV